MIWKAWQQAMLTIAPPPFASMSAAPPWRRSRRPRGRARGSAAIPRRHLERLVEDVGAGIVDEDVDARHRPRSSRRPCAATAACVGDVGLDEAAPCRPGRAIASATASPVAALSSAMTTAAPSQAKARAAASPMPWPAPVTIAILPASRPAMASPVDHGAVVEDGIAGMQHFLLEGMARDDRLVDLDAEARLRPARPSGPACARSATSTTSSYQGTAPDISSWMTTFGVDMPKCRAATPAIGPSGLCGATPDAGRLGHGGDLLRLEQTAGMADVGLGDVEGARADRRRRIRGGRSAARRSRSARRPRGDMRPGRPRPRAAPAPRRTSAGPARSRRCSPAPRAREAGRPWKSTMMSMSGPTASRSVADHAGRPCRRRGCGRGSGCRGCRRP